MKVEILMIGYRYMNNIAIQLTNITKLYTIHHEKPTLVEKFIKGRDESFMALNSIYLTIHKGEKVGIIGPNGSGKTTLLKIIAGITTPTTGAVTTTGRIVSLIDLEAGFHPDLSGYQNIITNGLLLGMKRFEIEQKLRSIISFADIKQFIDTPLFMYSEGMKLRLGFATAIYANPDILLLDEGIGVGDKEFQDKAKKQILKLFNKNKTIIIVSQYQKVIERYAKQIILMKNGSVVKSGTLKISSEYFK